MSIVSALDNQNKTVRITASTVATTAGATKIAVSIPGWPAWAYVGRVLVSANNNFSTLQCTITSDNAGYLAATGGAQSQFVQASKTDTASGVQAATFDFASAYSQDSSGLGFLNIIISSASAFTAGTIFTVTADARRGLANSLRDIDTTHRPYDWSFRVLRKSTTDVFDLTTRMRNASAVDITAINRASGTVALNAATDYLYVGSLIPPTNLAFLIPIATAQASGRAVVAEFWNGVAWTSVAALDNTSDGQTSPSGFSYSGTWKLSSAPVTWAAQKLSFDPLTIEENLMLGGTTTVVQNGVSITVPVSVYQLPSNPPRYWMRFSAPALSSPLTLRGLFPVN